MDYFNEEERAKQKGFADWRDRFFGPLLRGLVRVGFTPNRVTLVGVAFLLGAAAVPPDGTLWPMFWVMVLLGLYVLCDGIDGPLARHMGLSNPGGSLVDMVADQLGVVVLPAAAAYYYTDMGLSAVLFSTGYLVFIVFAVYTNEQQISIPGYLRVKYLFNWFYMAAGIGYVAALDWFMLAFGVYYWLMVWVALLAIYRHFEQVPQQEDDHGG